MLQRNHQRTAASLLCCMLLSAFNILIWHDIPSYFGDVPEVPRYAFATFVGSFTAADDTSRQSRIGREPDGYFLGARYLNYMLNHNSRTKSRSPHPIPLLVLATVDVHPDKVRQLRQEGAQVIITDKIEAPPWMAVGDARYGDVLTKLKLWQQTDFEKIAFFDADILINAPMDGIFEDAATEPQEIGSRGDHAIDNLPASYTFAAHPENYHYDHPIPPSSGDRLRHFDSDFIKDHPIPDYALRSDYLNAGFFVISPSQQLYDLYISKLQESFQGGSMPEQDLFNSVHNQTGLMPWQQLDWQWNAHYPTYKDFEAGVRSMHDKFWEDDAQDPDFRNDKTLRHMWREQIVEMEEYYQRYFSAG